MTLSSSTTTTLTNDSHNAIVSTHDEVAGEATLINRGTLSGIGTIGDVNLTLDNYGTIFAIASVNELILDTGTGSSNAIINEAGAKLEAKSGATLEIKSDVNNLDPATSVIQADDGGNVELINDTITGGALKLQSSGAATQLQIEGTVTLSSSTTTTLTNDSHNAIVSTHDEVAGEATLVNYGNISGAGTIGGRPI